MSCVRFILTHPRCRCLRELRRTNAPSALVEVAYHDNPEDAAWIRGNIDEIGKALSNAVAAYFGLR